MLVQESFLPEGVQAFDRRIVGRIDEHEVLGEKVPVREDSAGFVLPQFPDDFPEGFEMERIMSAAEDDRLEGRRGTAEPVAFDEGDQVEPRVIGPAVELEVGSVRGGKKCMVPGVETVTVHQFVSDVALSGSRAGSPV